jgi:hypothetical protein
VDLENGLPIELQQLFPGSGLFSHEAGAKDPARDCTLLRVWWWSDLYVWVGLSCWLGVVLAAHRAAHHLDLVTTDKLTHSHAWGREGRKGMGLK